MLFWHFAVKCLPGVSSLKKVSSLMWLGLIFGITVVVDLLSLAMGSSAGPIIVRLLFLSALFLMLIRGSQSVRYLLAVIYTFAGIAALLTAVRAADGATPVLFGFFGLFLFASAGFLLRSRVLRALTAK